jgi:hypothetical protein
MVKWKFQLPDRSLAILKIERVAVVFQGVVYSLPEPHRHIDVRTAIRKRIEMYGPHQEGFIDSLGNFLSREEAFKLAQANGQLRLTRRYVDGDVLYSEDIW